MSFECTLPWRDIGTLRVLGACSVPVVPALRSRSAIVSGLAERLLSRFQGLAVRADVGAGASGFDLFHQGVADRAGLPFPVGN